jgi:transcriptional regulator of acetoin/glycerol metabolism
MCRGGVITAGDLPERVRDQPAPVEVRAERTARGGSMNAAERQALEQALADSDGNVSEAVRKLGIGRTTAYRLMKKHGIRS